MITIVSDQPKLQRELESLVEQAVRGGAWFHEDLRLIAENGSVRVESSLPAGRDDLMISLPEEILLPLDEIRMSLSGDEIVIDSFADTATPERRRLFETVIRIYNLCGKIPAHRAASPRFAFPADGEIARLITAGRGAGKDTTETASDPLLDDFIQCRLFSHEDGSGKRRKVLMPMIDFYNHHPDAHGYLNETARHPDQPLIGVSHWKAAADQRECFVCYSLFDAFDMSIHYGYLERGCRFVKSVPLKIELEGVGKLRVISAGAASLRCELPSRLRDLRAWMPVVTRSSPQEIELSHLIIPGPSDRHALRRVLASMISAWKPGMDLEAVAELVASAERTVLAENIRCYEQLAEALGSGLESSPSLAQSILEMATLQLRLLHSYELGD